MAEGQEAVRISELESSVSERNHRIELLEREVGEKAARLKRLADPSE